MALFVDAASGNGALRLLIAALSLCECGAGRWEIMVRRSRKSGMLLGNFGKITVLFAGVQGELRLMVGANFLKGGGGRRRMGTYDDVCRFFWVVGSCGGMAGGCVQQAEFVAGAGAGCVAAVEPRDG